MAKVLEIKNKETLNSFCNTLLAEKPDFIALDTEFIREKTYWPRLCLIQLAYGNQVVMIDPLSPDIDLEPFYKVLQCSDILKVFHSARQDMEIFDYLMGSLPTPIFDTQVAAMVCGFKESVGYDTIVSELLGKRLDKSSQYTNWALRPLSLAQWRYAADDVIYLKDLYIKLLHHLKEHKRESWIEEEMKLLENPETYRVNPKEAWKRLKPRKREPLFLARLQALAALREQEAQRQNRPRSWVLKDEILTEMALASLKKLDDLKKLRGGESISPSLGTKILAILKSADTLPKEFCPVLESPSLKLPPLDPLLIDLLKLFLKYQCEAHHVAERIIASNSDLEKLIREKDKASIRALKGWRSALFGKPALDLLQGKLSLRIHKNCLEFV